MAQPRHTTSDPADEWQRRERDAQRRQHVSELPAQGVVSAPDDSFTNVRT